MNSVKLGNSGLNVSELCLGTMYFGVKVPDDDSFALMDMYYEAGGRFLDTANKYSTWVPGFPDPVGEKLVGRWMKDRGNRSEITVATKMGFGYHDVPRGLTRDLIISEAEKSLKRIGTDYIDLFYAHADDMATPQEETMEAMHSLVGSGKVRAIGASNYTAWRLALANRCAEDRGFTPYCCTQARLSPLWPRVQSDFGRQVPATPELLDYCRREDMAVLGYSPLLQGFFGRPDRDIATDYDTPDNRAIVAAFRKEADGKGVNANVVVLSWMKAHGYVPLITGSTPEQIGQNLQASDYKISNTCLEEVDALYFPVDPDRPDDKVVIR